MKVIVVEDSRLAREGLVTMLSHYPELQVIGEAEHPSSALILIEKTRPDVIFLDIHMPGESGFDLLDNLKYVPKIIFTTAYSEYAIRSFDYNTVDYLLKPISHERLAEAIHKLTAIEAEACVEKKLLLEINSRMFVKDDDKCHLVPLDSIQYFESCKNHVRIYFNTDNAFVKKSLSSIEERLPKKYFFRANRQFIINLQSIINIEESIKDGYDITMSDGKRLEISRRNAIELKEILSF